MMKNSMAKQSHITQYTKEETLVFYHKGVRVNVHIDYLNDKVSLVDQAGKPMKYCFAERELTYMNGWRLVLQSMDLAIQEAQKRLEAYKKRMEKEDEEFIIKSLKEISKEELS